MSRTVLLTGANGFVGRRLCGVLVARGDRVVGSGIEADRPAACDVASWHRADILDMDSITVAVRETRPDWVVHLAGQASAGLSFSAPTETFRVNALGTWNVVEAVRLEAPGARILAVGSGEVYGPQPADSLVEESAHFFPVSPYALSKAASDALAETQARAHGLDVVRTRSFSHAGPGQAPNFVIPSWARQIAAIERDEAEPVLRVGNLEVTRDIAHVDDVVQAYVALLERGRSGQAYNVCSGRAVRLTDVARMLTALATREIDVRVDPDRVRPADVPYLVGSRARLTADTGWEPAHTLQQALREVLDEWRSH